ncbi:MAG: FtsH protease activity modulator HflK [Gemmobacter sp.]|jgi:membrane protease subunit HflK|nr:FtsH protease activity modulator HflK [Gemmobacter sp.]
MSSGGPWGGGGGDNRDNRNDGRGPRRPGNEGPQIDEIVKKGQEQLRVLMGGRVRSGGGGPGGGNGSPFGPIFSKQGIMLGVLVAAGLWSYLSFYTVKPEERSVELFLGEFRSIGNPGLNFAPWPLVTAEVVPVTGERTTDIGSGRNGEMDSGLMLTRDQNIVDMDFQVVWNISDPAAYLFNLAEPAETVRAVSSSAMRDIIARLELTPVLNTGRGPIAADLRANVQATLDSYRAGINVVRVNFNRADPPAEVKDAFREVQAAQQERDRLEKEADAYANRVTAGARGEAARLMEDAAAYRARVVNDAQGEASRFLAVYEEYAKAPEVTRKRMYLETMEGVLGNVDKVILDGKTSEGVLPYLPLDSLRRPPQEPAAPTTTTGGN